MSKEEEEAESTLRQELEEGLQVILDKDRASGNVLVNVVNQTSGRLYTTISSGKSEWVVMTIRLSKKY